MLLAEEVRRYSVAKAAERLDVGGWQNECASLMTSVQKINVIKQCREITGMGLVEAKAAVETFGVVPL